jgi:hypothetical protein
MRRRPIRSARGREEQRDDGVADEFIVSNRPVCDALRPMPTT